ncbi:Colicin V production protein [Geosporobacter subterraneus DSM 17957]|uniref:Colicin V production protein n=1 Tax=Geosporobacter subterraneus DSM 17957 TaxID=1121919 RepID=A0A1M6KD64_9FIRM|nr:CvpA family protein [Geosporobacter subterraneus]SHJ56890.1 Colicin V production protein [Geosporobacter subterraneus DSM 17957]
MGWFDILVLVILVIHAIKGWQRGFVLSFFSLISVIAAAVTAKLYHTRLSEYLLDNTPLLLKLQQWVGIRVKDAAYQEVASRGDIASDNIYQILGMPRGIQELFMGSETMRGYSAKAMEGVYAYVADVLARMFIDLLSILLIFICVRIALMLIGHLLDGIFSLPILNQFNHMGGLAFGGLKGLLIIFILLLLMVPINTMAGEGLLAEGLENSVFAKFLYDHNLLLSMIGKIL